MVAGRLAYIGKEDKVLVLPVSADTHTSAIENKDNPSRRAAALLLCVEPPFAQEMSFTCWLSELRLQYE